MSTKTEKYNLEGVKGVLEVWAYRSGELLSYSKNNNAITLEYKNFLAGAVTGELAMNTFEIGTGNTAPVLADTALVASVFSKDIEAGDLSKENNVLSLSLSVEAGEANSGSPLVKEVGVFMGATGGSGDSLIARALIVDPVTKNDATTINILWTWTFGDPA